MEKSIYQQILEHISDGVLDDGFSLPDETGRRSPLRFAPGAFDGMCIYHFGHSAADAETEKQMAAALKAAAKGDFPEADILFYEWTKEHRAVTYIDDLQNFVYGHTKELDPGNVHRVALSMVLQSKHIECVKIGLELLELFGEPQENVKEIIRSLGLYDEFTIFSVWNMQRWKNGNQEIFSLAQKTHGWGRIHAVERLEPETEEIRHWFLTEGTINDVVNEYSSLTCWKKSGAGSILFEHPNPDEFHGIITLIEGLLDKGPVRGMSGLDNAESILLRFLELAPEYALTAEDYDTILSIREWAEDEDVDLPSVAKAGDDILHTHACTAAIEKAVEEGSGLKLAKALNIPFRDQLLSYMERDFDRSCHNVSYLLEDSVYIEPVLKLFHEKLPLDEMKGDPIDGPCMGSEYKEYNQLQFLIQELDDKPLTGVPFIKAALESPVSRNRYRALTVLQAWVQAEECTLLELLPEIHKEVLLLQKKEINEGNSKMIVPLLEGETKFSDEG